MTNVKRRYKDPATGQWIKEWPKSAGEQSVRPDKPVEAKSLSAPENKGKAAK
jgi:hypothetical protein